MHLTTVGDCSSKSNKAKKDKRFKTIFRDVIAMPDH